MKFPAALGAVLILAPAAMTSARASGADWRELRSASFVVRSRVAPARLQSLVCDVEAVSNAFAGALDAPASPDRMLEVVAVDNDRDERELLPRFWERFGPRPSGAYWSGPLGHHLVVRVDTTRDERLKRFSHEYAHYAVHLTHRAPPRWLDEGLAELWENASITDQAVTLGGVVAEHLKTLRSASRWIPLDALTAATELPRDGRDVAMFYAEAWALAHYFVVGPPGSGPLLEGAAGLMPPSDEQLRRYVADGMASQRRFTTAPYKGGCGDWASRALPEVEALVFRARALADGDRPDAARPLVDRVLRLDREHQAGLETKGIIAFVGNHPSEAATIFDHLISTGKGSYLVYYYRALLAGPIPNLTDGPGRVPEIEYLRRALVLAPGFEPARERLKELGGLSW
jgi:hypothetical protein